MKPCPSIAIALGVVGLFASSGQGRGIPGSVVFYSARTGNNEIFLMNPDGTDPTRITVSPASDVDPDISTNGREIVFSSNRTGNNDIFVTDRDGISVTNLTSNPANDGWARWSPNGHQIAFHSNRDGNFEIYVMNADGSNVTRLTDYAGVDQYPDWSPDGKEIVFRRDIDIYAIDLTDGSVRRLTQAPVLNQMPAWSPNGKRLAFMSLREGYCAVFVMNADGSEQTNLTPKQPGRHGRGLVQPGALVVDQRTSDLLHVVPAGDAGRCRNLPDERRRHRPAAPDLRRRHGRKSPDALTLALATSIRRIRRGQGKRHTYPSKGARRRV